MLSSLKGILPPSVFQVITDSAPGEGEEEDNRRHSLTRRIHQLFQLDSDALELKSQLKTEGGLGEVIGRSLPFRVPLLHPTAPPCPLPNDDALPDD
jgi:hypothetical protein